MPTLRINLLGPFAVSLDEQPVYQFRTNKAQALLAYLAVEQEAPHRREALMTLLWPDLPLESAQINLRQTIYRLRQAIREVGSAELEDQLPVLLSDRQTVQLNPQAGIQVDVHQFESLLESEPEQAVALYRGDFLSDFFLVDSSEFETWAEGVRERLRRQVLLALSDLAEAQLQAEEYQLAQSWAWRQIEIDPLREPAYQQLMIALEGGGQRSAALSQYQLLERRLKEELDIRPSDETRNLFERIRADEQERTLLTLRRGRPHDLNRTLVFLLTDIEHSTELWDRHRQAMLQALMRHNEILEKQIEAHSGRILELRGDGVKAVFEVGDPLSCVLAIQREIAATDWGEVGQLRIRIGLHGMAAVRRDFEFFEERDNYFGPVLNHTARVMDAGWGGQILVSEQVHSAFALPPGASWQDFGLHQLRSLERPVHIYGLTHPDLPAQTFPPLRTRSDRAPSEPQPESRPRHNLIRPPTAFVGRRRELSELEEFFADRGVRLVTIVGPGGMGKTRLAVAAAEALVEEPAPGQHYLFPDGVFFVGLASLHEAEQIVPAIGKVLNVPLEASQNAENRELAARITQDQRECLVGFLASRRILLILDNLEHLRDAAPIIGDLLEAMPTLRVLATSRERLHIREEQVYPIYGLDYPERDTFSELSEYAAIQLFLQSARRLQPDFEPGQDDLAELVRICRLVGGMPLGLEIAASWIDVLSIREIAAEIRRSLDFLETDIRNIPDRHRSIRAVFDSSWRRLSESEQRIFARLAIFRGSFSRAAAEQVTGATLRNLATLVGQSLLQYNQDTRRYRIHKLLRQYAQEKLSAIPGEEFKIGKRHSEFCAQFIEQNVSLFMSGQTQIAMDRLEVESANILAAWKWALQQANFDHLDRVLNGILLYHDWNWQIDEALALCQHALEKLRRHGFGADSDPILAKRLRAKILAWQGLFTLQYRHDQSALLLDQSEALVDELLGIGEDTRQEKCQIHLFYGLLHYLSGDRNVAQTRLEAAISLGREIGWSWIVQRSLRLLGHVARIAGAPGEARRLYAQALAEARLQQNCWSEVVSLHDLGWAARSLMAYQEAQDYYEESLALAKKCGHQREAAGVLQSMGFLAIFRGHLDQATTRFAESVEAYEQIGLPYGALAGRAHIGIAYWMSGNFSRAEAEIRETIAVSENLNAEARIFPEICLVELLTILGRYQEASRQSEALDSLLPGVFIERFVEGRLLRVRGWIALAQRDYPAARRHFARSIEVYDLITDDEQIAWSQAGLAGVALCTGDYDEARRLLTDSLWTTIEIQAFIPLMFSLPVLCLYLARDDPERAASLYSQIQASPFVARSALFQDALYQFLPDAIISSAVPPASAANHSELRQQLWSAAAHILSTWMKSWREDAELEKG